LVVVPHLPLSARVTLLFLRRAVKKKMSKRKRQDLDALMDKLHGAIAAMTEVYNQLSDSTTDLKVPPKRAAAAAAAAAKPTPVRRLWKHKLTKFVSNPVPAVAAVAADGAGAAAPTAVAAAGAGTGASAATSVADVEMCNHKFAQFHRACRRCEKRCCVQCIQAVSGAVNEYFCTDCIQTMPLCPHGEYHKRGTAFVACTFCPDSVCKSHTLLTEDEKKPYCGVDCDQVASHRCCQCNGVFSAKLHDLGDTEGGLVCRECLNYQFPKKRKVAASK
jgi:hypothetical protein